MVKTSPSRDNNGSWLMVLEGSRSRSQEELEEEEEEKELEVVWCGGGQNWWSTQGMCYVKFTDGNWLWTDRRFDGHNLWYRCVNAFENCQVVGFVLFCKTWLNLIFPQRL